MLFVTQVRSNLPGFFIFDIEKLIIIAYLREIYDSSEIFKI